MQKNLEVIAFLCWYVYRQADGFHLYYEKNIF